MLDSWMMLFGGIGIGIMFAYPLGVWTSHRQLEKLAGIDLARQDRSNQRLALENQGKQAYYNSKRNGHRSTHERAAEMVDSDGVVISRN